MVIFENLALSKFPSAIFLAPSSSLVRTGDSQSSNTGSNPVGATKCESRETSLCNCLKIKAGLRDSRGASVKLKTSLIINSSI